MNKRLLLFILPLVAGALHMRSLASWRPQKVFVSSGGISQLVFSEAGHRLLILQTSYAPQPVENNKVALVKWLLEESADRSLKTKAGKTALDLAQQNENKEVVALLQGADDDWLLFGL